jgi:hypothetical protein
VPQADDVELLVDSSLRDLATLLADAVADAKAREASWLRLARRHEATLRGFDVTSHGMSEQRPAHARVRGDSAGHGERIARVLNPRLASSPHRSPDPFSAGHAWRPMRLVVDDRSVQDREMVELFELVSSGAVMVYHSGGRHSARVRRVPTRSDARIARFDLKAPSDVERTTVLQLEGISDRARVLARKPRRPVKDVRALLELAALCRRDSSLDRFISDDPLVTTAWTDFYDVQGSAEGLALAGLALRANNDYRIDRFTALRTDRFHRAAAFGLLGPMSMPYSAVTMSRLRGGSSRPFVLLDSVVTRLARALRARDLLQVRLRSRDLDTAWDDVLLFFDAFLVALVGVLDSSARLVEEVGGRSGDAERRPTWSDKRWTRPLRKAYPEFGVVLDPPFVSAPQIVSPLRNRVHAEPLSDELHDDVGARWQSFGKGVIAVPRDRRGTGMLDAAERDGKAIEWGLVDRPDFDAVFVNPGLTTERAVRKVAAHTAKVLELLDWSQLRDSDGAPVVELDAWVPASEHQRRAFLLSGLGDPGLHIDVVTV